MMLAAFNRRHSSTRECSASWCYICSSLGLSTDIANLALIYISMMGSQDLTDALRITILNANYMAKHLEVSCHHQMNLDLVWSRVRVGHPSCPIPWGTGKLLPCR
jgi:glycine cleavage system protein P-like pyridoxal-binding family